MMRWIRGIVNAVLMATLVKPVVRRMVARWRKRAQESPATTIGIPVQELLEAALIEELGASVADLQPLPAEAAEELAGRGTVRTMLIVGVVVAVIAGTAVAITALIRRRREAQAEGSEWVAVPVEASPEDAEDAEAAEAQAALID